MGARGHLNKLYKIKKNGNYCFCDNFDLVVRKKIKRCNININNLEVRIINAINSGALNCLNNINFNNLFSKLIMNTSRLQSKFYPQ